MRGGTAGVVGALAQDLHANALSLGYWDNILEDARVHESSRQLAATATLGGRVWRLPVATQAGLLCAVRRAMLGERVPLVLLPHGDDEAEGRAFLAHACELAGDTNGEWVMRHTRG
jgi:hypothetical protein